MLQLPAQLMIGIDIIEIFKTSSPNLMSDRLIRNYDWSKYRRTA